VERRDDMCMIVSSASTTTIIAQGENALMILCKEGGIGQVLGERYNVDLTGSVSLQRHSGKNIAEAKHYTPRRKCALFS
jgi:hypothetical protein